jgi:hypothetical protein
MSYRSNGGGQTKCSPWSSRLGVGRGDKDISEKFSGYETMEEAKPHIGCRARKNETEQLEVFFISQN